MRRDRLPEGPDDRLVVAGLGLAALGPLVVASLLVTVRDHMARSNAALVFVIVVVLAAALGGRWAGVTAAVISAMSYDFFLTRPYGSLKIDELEDIVATWCGHIAVTGRRSAGRTRSPACIASRNRSRRAPLPKTCWSPSAPS